MMRKLLFALGVSLSALSLYAQVDSIQLRNLDSLYLSWANERLLIPISLLPPTDTLAPLPDKNIPDSVYESRLEAIPTVVDLTYNKHVKRFIELYVVKRKKEVEMMMGLAEYYFPIFEEAIMELNLPLELKYMPIIESGLNPVATSRVGAQGLWQFMYRTAKGYDLEINSFVDDRWDPVKSSQAAVRYLKDLFDIYGDWYLVIAAYNCGPGNVNKAIRRSGGKRNYWDIYYHLPRETRGYVPAFIGVIYAMNYHYLHNIQPAEPTLPILVDTVHVQHKIHLDQVAKVLDIPKRTLRKLNPQYRRSIIPATSNTYPLQLPVDKSLDYIVLEDSITMYKRQHYFSQSNQNKAPTYTKYIPDPPKGDFSTLKYTVKSGDNLGFIAEWYDVGLSKLKYWNGIYGNRIKAGQALTIYVPTKQKSVYEKLNTMTFTQKQALEGKSTTVEKVVQEVLLDDFEYYTVKSGDNLWSIAQQFPGVSNTDIMKLNRMDSPKLKIGQIIKIKAKEN